jgi:hypothetical protein
MCIAPHMTIADVTAGIATQLGLVNPTLRKHFGLFLKDAEDVGANLDPNEEDAPAYAGLPTTPFVAGAAGVTLIVPPCGASSGRGIAIDASVGGRVVVGTASCAGASSGRAFVWTARTGARDLAMVLASAGGPVLSPEELGEARAVSGDGLTIAGRTSGAGVSPGWVVFLPRLLACSAADVADTDGNPVPDGSVDNGDFQAFFAAFFVPEADPARLAADVANTDGDPVPDGSVDNGDFQAFFSAFFSPCAG